MVKSPLRNGLLHASFLNLNFSSLHSISTVMKSKETDNWGQKEILAEMGKQIRLKRYLSNISISFAAFNTGLSRSTIHRIENGDPGVSIGAIYKLLVQIGEEKNLLNLAGVNEIVEALVENKVLRRPRAKKRKPGRTIELGQSHMKELMT